MKHHAFVVGLCIAAGCTYNEYKSYYTTPEEGTLGGSDAGVDDHGNGGSSGAAGAGGSGFVAQAGSSAVGNAGNGGASSAEDCTGCARVSVLSGRTADYQLELAARRNLSTSLVLFRVRVRDYVGDVSLIVYIESGDHLDLQQGFAADSTVTFATLNSAQGWQDVGIDLQQISSFRASSFEDAGGTAGGGFDPGFPFDKSRVRRVGMFLSPNAGSGLLTPATIELDSVTFSTAPDLNVPFSANPGGFELVDPDSGSVSLAAE